MKKAQQTAFWEGNFGDSYSDRNVIASSDRTSFFARILQRTYGVSSICELGANRGHNLQAIGSLSPNFSLTGVDINAGVVAEMKADSRIDAHCCAIQDYSPGVAFDLVFVSGVLIHVAPDDLPVIYRKLFELSQRYVLMNEYFNPTPVEIPYRGHQDRLYKRDFGGEFWDLHQDRVRLVDYGFLWKRCEPAWDNTTWWLFEKMPAA